MRALLQLVLSAVDRSKMVVTKRDSELISFFGVTSLKEAEILFQHPPIPHILHYALSLSLFLSDSQLPVGIFSKNRLFKNRKWGRPGGVIITSSRPTYIISRRGRTLLSLTSSHCLRGPAPFKTLSRTGDVMTVSATRSVPHACPSVRPSVCLSCASTFLDGKIPNSRIPVDQHNKGTIFYLLSERSRGQMDKVTKLGL